MINEKIRKYRIKSGLSQENVSKKLGISQNAYSKIESGETKLTIDRIERLAEIFNLSLVDLIANETQKIKIKNNQAIIGNVTNLTLSYAEKEILESKIELLEKEINLLKKVMDATK